MDASDYGRESGQFYWGDETAVDPKLVADLNDLVVGRPTCLDFDINAEYRLHDYGCWVAGRSTLCELPSLCEFGLSPSSFKQNEKVERVIDNFELSTNHP